jgi:hypothetical protein
MKTKRSRKQRARRKTVQANISAFEIVPRGFEIVLESTQPIHEEALGSGLRVDNMRTKAVSSRAGREVRLKVDDSFSGGRNTLRLSDLYTARNEPIDADLEIPFFVVDSKTRFPKDVKIQAYSRVVVRKESIRRAAPGEAPTHELMKGTRRATGKPWEAAYDRAGKRVDFNKVRAQVMKARMDHYGKLQPSLHKRLARAGSDRLSVAIWLRSDSLVKRTKSDRREARKMPAEEVRARKAFSEQAQRFVEKYDLVRAYDLRVDEMAPIIFAELDRQTIRRLAETPEVSMVFLYDRRGFDDLSDSLAIAQSDDAHTLGYTGSDVKVAVYEKGPDDTTDLRITARFRTDPDTSDHSRHTHGIIKNRQRDEPHGHAPDCRLHSANDYDLDAIRWAAKDKGCTVISQSFHREDEQTDSDLSFDDIYKDLLALNWPYPTICEAAGNGEDTEFVNHKGYNRLAVANHDDSATGMSGNTVFRNPDSDHGDRELPEISANGTGVETVGLRKSGTSMAAPAVAGATACLQEVDGVLKSWPEGCRAIHLASARLNPDGRTWWNDVIAGNDAVDGTGALNTLNAVRVAEQRQGRNNRPAPRGWDVGTLRSRDIGRNDETTFSYRVSIPEGIVFRRTYVKVALAWDSDVLEWNFLGLSLPVSSALTLDLDLNVYDSSGNLVARSASYDNSYEIAEFYGNPGETYTIKIQRWSGTDDVWYGLAWNTRRTWFLDVREVAGIRSGITLER